MFEPELPFGTHRVRKRASWVVVLVGWAALLGTTARWYHWEIASDPIALDYDIAPGGQSVERFVMHVDGHPQMLTATWTLRLQEPGRDLSDVYVDAGPLDLPVVESPTSIPPWDGYRTDSAALSYVSQTRCTELPCDIEFVLRAAPTGTAYTRHFVVQGVLEGRDANEPPPGRVTLERVQTP